MKTYRTRVQLSVCDRTERRDVVLRHYKDGYWVALCPSLRGCVTQGDNRRQALANIREAIAAYIEAVEDRDDLRFLGKLRKQPRDVLPLEEYLARNYQR